MTELLLRFLYGAVVIAAGFIIGSMGRLSIKEALTVGVRGAANSVYFWIAFYVFASSIGHVIICTIRVIQSYHGAPTPAHIAPYLAVGFTFLVVGKVGFNWAGTRELRHGPTIWWSFVISLGAWALLVFTGAIEAVL